MDILPWIMMAQRTEVQGSALAQFLRWYTIHEIRGCEGSRRKCQKWDVYPYSTPYSYQMAEVL